MMKAALKYTTSPVVFLVSVATVYLTAFLVVDSMPMVTREGPLTYALAFDLIVFVPALYYMILVRRNNWPLFTLLPVTILSIYAATNLIGLEHVAILDLASYLVIPLELFLFGYVSYGVYKAFSVYRKERKAIPDAHLLIEKSLSEVVPQPKVAALLAFEFSLIYYALFSWHTRPAGQQAGRFTSYKDVGYSTIFLTICVLIVIELIVVHLVFWLLGYETVAWILTGLSIYGLIWLIGDYRAILLRPIVLNKALLEIRVGLRHHASIPIENIAHVRRLSYRDKQIRGSDCLNAALLGDADYEIMLTEEMAVKGMYGMERSYRSIRLQVDDKARFEANVERLGLVQQ